MTEQQEMNDESKNTNMTQVTNLNAEEIKTGKKVELPTPEKLAERFMFLYIKSMEDLQVKLFDKSISKISIAKAIMAGLDLPEEDKTVELKTADEKEIFHLVQMAINTRMLLTKYNIEKQMKEKNTV